MPPRNRVKLGLTIPVESRSRSFEASHINNGSTSALSTSLPSPSRRNLARSPRPQPSLPRPIPAPPPAPMRKARLEKDEEEELEKLVHANAKSSCKRMTKQLSMSDRPRDAAWEKRRRQVIRQEKRRNSVSGMASSPSPLTDPSVTDADLHELKGSIELGFGFNEEEGQRLCSTLPALDLYFAVNRQVFQSPVPSPRPAPANTPTEDSWRICDPGDDPQQVKAKLRHWAQAVACSVMQSF